VFRRVVYFKFTDASEVVDDSIIRETYSSKHL
jgi:hypothetical protein